MDKIAQWKASILGINKSGHGGPSKGKHQTHAPMAKFAKGGKVVKMAKGGKPNWYSSETKAPSPNQYGRDTSIPKIRVRAEMRDSSIPLPKAKVKARAKAKIKDGPMSDADILKWNLARAGKDDAPDAGYKPSMPDPTNTDTPDYAKGGKVKGLKMGSKKVQKHDDEAQDKILFGKMLKAENKKEKMGFALKKGGKVKKKYAEGGSVRVQGNMKRPQFSANKSFDGGSTRVGLSAGKDNVRASFSKKFADGGAVTKLANEASGIINDMTKNRVPMKKGGKVKKAC